jgi:hypothetical protein
VCGVGVEDSGHDVRRGVHVQADAFGCETIDESGNLERSHTVKYSSYPEQVQSGRHVVTTVELPKVGGDLQAAFAGDCASVRQSPTVGARPRRCAIQS